MVQFIRCGDSVINLSSITEIKLVRPDDYLTRYQILAFIPDQDPQVLCVFSKDDADVAQSVMERFCEALNAIERETMMVFDFGEERANLLSRKYLYKDSEH